MIFKKIELKSKLKGIELNCYGVWLINRLPASKPLTISLKKPQKTVESRKDTVQRGSIQNKKGK